METYKMNYLKFTYIYPSSPKRTTSPKYLDNFDNGEYLIAPNYTGKRCIVFTNGYDVMVYDHRKKVLRNVSQDIELRKLSPFKTWFAYEGIYCADHTFIITDCLVWNSQYQLNTLFKDRMDAIEEIFAHIPLTNSQFIFTTDMKGIFVARYHESNFANLYEQMKKEKYIGCVLRKHSTPLQDATRSPNNRNDMLLCKEQNLFSFLK